MGGGKEKAERFTNIEEKGKIRRTSGRRTSKKKNIRKKNLGGDGGVVAVDAVAPRLTLSFVVVVVVVVVTHHPSSKRLVVIILRTPEMTAPLVRVAGGPWRSVEVWHPSPS